MLNGPLVFVDIDTQRDFLDPDGALYVPDGTAILENLGRLTEFARRHGIPVLATACAHTPDDVDELARFGPHCMIGTPGQARVAATAWPGGRVIAPDGRFESEEAGGIDVGDRLPPHLTLEKRAFDLFSHPKADRILARYDRDRPTFVVYGVATDYCVRAAVLGLRHRGARVAVVVDAIRPIDAAHEPDVLAEFTAAGALLTLTEVVCGNYRTPDVPEPRKAV